MRLQKFLSQAGVASRRNSERLILEGKVAVNGIVITQLGTKIDSDIDIVTVNKKIVKVEKNKVYIALNKPRGYISSLEDPHGRKKVVDLIKNVEERIYPVGRLDYDTEGLLLLTNDGDFTYALTHPKHEIKKVYIAKVRGLLTNHDLHKLETGIILSDGITAPAEAAIIKKEGNNSLVRITLHEGRNRQVRRMMEAIGHPVIKLKRIKIGCISLNKLKVGEYRYLSNQEVQNLLNLANN